MAVTQGTCSVIYATAPGELKRGVNTANYNIPNSEIATLIDEWISGRNAERDRRILKRRLIDGVCYEPLAEEFGLSVRRIKKIVHISEIKLFKHIK